MVRLGLLHKKGFRPGIRDKATLAALGSLQKELGVPATLRLDADTVAALIKPLCAVPRVGTGYAEEAGDPRLCRWFDETYTPARGITYTLDPSVPQGFAGPIAEAFAKWSYFIPVHFVRLAFPPSLGEPLDLVIRLDPNNPGFTPSVPGERGVAIGDYPPHTRCFETGRSLTGRKSNLPLELVFNAQLTWRDGTNAAPGWHDVESTALHEIGHILGIGHIQLPTAVMFRVQDPETVRTILQPIDIAAVQSRYGFRWRDTTAFDVVSISSDRMLVAAISEGCVWSRDWNGQWGQLNRMTTDFALDVASDASIAGVRKGDKFCDLFAIDEKGSVQTAFVDQATGSFRGWYPISGRTFGTASQITAVSHDSDHIDLFVVDFGAALASPVHHNGWNGSWGGWSKVGTKIFAPESRVTAVTKDGGFIDLFVAGEDGVIWWAYFDGQWHDWQPLLAAKPGPTFASLTRVAAVSRDSDFVDIFAVADDGSLWSNWWNGGWKGWLPVGNLPNASFIPGCPVSAISREKNRMDIFLVDADGHVQVAYWNGNPWKWASLGKTTFAPGSHIVATSRDPNFMDVFVPGLDGLLWLAWWNGSWSKWTPMQQIGPLPNNP